MIRALLVEYPEAVRRAFRALLALESDLTLIGEAGDIQAAAPLAGALRPDLIVLDAEIPYLDLSKALCMLRERSPASQILILTQDAAGLEGVLYGAAITIVS